MNVPVLGATRFPSPLKRWVDASERVPATILRTVDAPSEDRLLFELAGAREHLFFHPPETRAGMVTCGGLCPGLNDIVRSLFLEMHHAYGVKEVLGSRWGYQGLDPEHGAEPLVLTHENSSAGRHHSRHVGYLHDRFIHVPIELLATQREQLDPDSSVWSAVLSATGQPHRFE